MNFLNVNTDKIQSITVLDDGKYVYCYEKIQNDQFINKNYIRYEDGSCLCVGCGTSLPPIQKDSVWTFGIDDNKVIVNCQMFDSEEEMFENEVIVESDPIRLAVRTQEDIDNVRETVLAAEPGTVFFMPVLNEYCPACIFRLTDSDSQTFSTEEVIDIIDDSIHTLEPTPKVIIDMEDGSYYVYELDDYWNLVSTHYVKE